MSILAIDPALSCGWAHSGRQWGVEQFVKRPWRHPYAHYLDFRGWLLDRITDLEVTALAYESAFSFSKRGGAATRMEWQGVIHSVAAECDLPVAGVLPNTLKKYATGNGRAEKPEMTAALGERFDIWLGADLHDAVDAIWVLSWASEETNEGRLRCDWSGFPQGSRSLGREAICNTCQQRFQGGMICPRCRGSRTRLEA